MSNQTGTAGPNTLLGSSGNETLSGLGGNDRLEGRAGNDTLIGGTGIDLLVGGAGNDIYVIDNATEINKATLDAGIDTVQSSVTYTLGANQEHLTLTGTAAINGTGNDGANTLTGNEKVNQLSGLIGNDLLKGNGGNDTLNGGAGGDNLQGGAGADVLSGNAGNDRLLGGEGADTLIFDAADVTNVDGGGGSDTLKVQGADATADLVALNATTPVFKNIEVINLSASGGQTVVLDEATATALNGAHTIVVKGTDADAVLADGSWTVLSDTVVAEITYHRYQSGEAILQIQDGIDTSAISESTAVLELSALDGANGTQFTGELGSDYLTAVASAGDVNGDGYDDVIVGAVGADPNGSFSGAAYVVFGTGDGFGPDFSLSTLNGGNGFQISGEAANDQSGTSVSSAGDVNGDGFADLLVGGPRVAANGAESGAAYVIFGKAAGFASNLELSALDGTNGFQISGEAEGDRAGNSARSAGDLNGDGYGDLIIGAYNADANDNSNSGASYVVYGKADFSATAGTFELSALDGSDGFQISGEAIDDVSGFSVSAAGDVNGDGLADVLIGARGAGNSTGASYVIFGSTEGFGSNLDLSGLDGTNGFQLTGEGFEFFENAGRALSSAGDVNGDGFSDLIVGAMFAGPNGGSSGAAYVIFGGEAFSAEFMLSALNGTNGFQISGEAADDRAGASVSAAGDVNGDGFDDLIIGAIHVDPHGSESGAGYLVFGAAGGFSSNLDLSTLDGSNGLQISGEAEGDQSGDRVSGAGDVNGDGFDDLLVSSSRNDEGGSDAGAAYLVYGQDFRNEVDYSGTSANDSHTGGDADEIILGGYGYDILFGGGGADVLKGGIGNDQVWGDAGDDWLEGGGEIDIVHGGEGNDHLEGGGGSDYLSGDEGNDFLDGGLGNDVYNYNLDAGASNADEIVGFVHGQDVVQLAKFIFTTLATSTVSDLNAAEFQANATGTATETDDRIIYNTESGALYYDADGSDTGSGNLLIALLLGAPQIDATDIFVGG